MEGRHSFNQYGAATILAARFKTVDDEFNALGAFFEAGAFCSKHLVPF
jgi:hypothetical protein